MKKVTMYKRTDTDVLSPGTLVEFLTKIKTYFVFLCIRDIYIILPFFVRDRVDDCEYFYMEEKEIVLLW